MSRKSPARRRIKQRAATKASPKTCRAPGCQRAALSATEHGVGSLCRPHLEFLRRHGHVSIRSLEGRRITPYRHAAFHWVRANAHNAEVKVALEGILCCMALAGPYVPASSINGLSARQRADAVWSRLRQRQVHPMVLLAGGLGILAALNNTPFIPTREYRLVQLGKLLNRLGGGTVRIWRRTSTPHRRQELRKFQESDGPTVRRLGELLERGMRTLAGDAMVIGEVLRVKADLEAKGLKLVRPYPNRFANKARRAVVSILDDGPPDLFVKTASPKSVEQLQTPSGPCLAILKY